MSKELKQAVNNRDYETVKQLLDANPCKSVNTLFKQTLDLISMDSASTNYDGKTDPLFHIAMEFVKHGANVNTVNNYDDTFIKLCIAGQQTQLLEAFLKTHIAKIKRDDFFDALLDAGDYSDAKLLLTMLDIGKTIYDYDEFDTMHRMVQRDSVEGMQWLLGQGCHIDKYDDDDYTPLMVAAEYDHSESIAFLLDQGADPLLVDDQGRCALDIIIENLHDPSEPKSLELLASAVENATLNKTIKNPERSQAQDIAF